MTMRLEVRSAGGLRPAARHSGGRVSVRFLADLFELSVSRIYRLVDDGVIPRAGRGTYDLVESVQSYIRHLRSQIGEVEVEGAGSFGAERTRLVAARADMAEAECKRMAAELVPANQLEAAWQEFATEVRSTLLALPNQIAPRLAEASADPARLATIMRDAVVEAMAEIAGTSGSPAARSTHRRAALERGRRPGSASAE